MAYYAFLDLNNVVTEVIPGKDETDTSHNWEEYYGSIRNQICKRTSYNTRQNVHYNSQGEPDNGVPFRGNYAGIDYTYDTQNDIFMPPKPYPSWILNVATASWDPPIPYPTDGKVYNWNETTQSWDLVDGQ